MFNGFENPRGLKLGMFPAQRIALRAMGRFFGCYTRIPVGRVVFSDVVRGDERKAVHWG